MEDQLKENSETPKEETKETEEAKLKRFKPNISNKEWLNFAQKNVIR